MNHVHVIQLTKDWNLTFCLDLDFSGPQNLLVDPSISRKTNAMAINPPIKKAHPNFDREQNLHRPP